MDSPIHQMADGCALIISSGSKQKGGFRLQIFLFLHLLLQYGQLLGHLLYRKGQLRYLDRIMKADQHEKQEPENKERGGGGDGPDEMGDGHQEVVPDD